jgi:hypothetical protein
MHQAGTTSATLAHIGASRCSKLPLTCHTRTLANMSQQPSEARIVISRITQQILYLWEEQSKSIKLAMRVGMTPEEAQEYYQRTCFRTPARVSKAPESWTKISAMKYTFAIIPVSS